MAATAALQTGLPLGLVQVRDVAVQGGHHSKKQTLSMCKECRRHLSSGLKSSSQHGIGKTLGRVSASSGREGAFGQGRLGQSVNSTQSAWSGRRVSLKGGSSGRPSLQIHAQEPDDAEKDVEVKEALLRDALSEKNKKTEEVQQTGFKVENRQQVTAIVTGVISILLAVGYLSLLSLDTRGVNLIPPPPEAYGE